MGVCEGLCVRSDKNNKTHSNRLAGLPLVDAEGIIGKTQNRKRYKARGGAAEFVCVCVCVCVCV